MTHHTPTSSITRRQFLGSLLAGAMYLPIRELLPSSTTNRLREVPATYRWSAMPLRVLTLNVWGIPVASDRADRMQAIGEQITALAPDIVTLQEALALEDRERIVNYLAPGQWPYSHYFPSGIVGSGLMIISRFPVVDADFYRFRLSGRPERLLEADYYAGKGIGMVRVQTPAGLLDVYDIHVLAQYGPDADDPYIAHRATNLYEAARFIDAQSSGNPVLFCGDLNTRPDQLGYRLITLLGKVVDCYADANPGDAGITYSPSNPYADQEPPQRIDYVFVRNAASLGFNIRSAQVALKDKPPGNARAYSDHYGVLVELELAPTPAAASPGSDAQQVGQALKELSDALQWAQTEAQGRQAAQAAQTGIGFAATPGSAIAGHLLQRRWKIPGGMVKYLAMPLAAAYTVLNGALLLFRLPDEMQALKALSDEVAWQIRARRAFNGIEW